MTDAKPKRTAKKAPSQNEQLSLRDVFAAVALHVHLSHGKPCDQATQMAYQTADLMLEQRDADNA